MLRCALLLLLAPLGGFVHAAEAAGTAHAEPGRPVDKAGPRHTPEADLSRAKLSYERGDYGAAIQALRPLLYPAALLADEEDVILAHKLLGLSSFFEHDEAGAEQEFNQLLALRPDFALDPVVEPLKAVAFVDSLRRKNEERLGEIRRRQAAEEAQRRHEEQQRRVQAEAQARQKAQRIYIERTIRPGLSALTFVPFGAPQLADHRRAVGALLLTGEGLTAAASLSTWLTVRLRYPNNTFPPRELSTATALTATYLTTGAVFWALIATGLIDALLHAKTVVKTREIHENRENRSSAAHAPAKLRLSLSPTGVEGRF